jgi:hypothetical protein
MTIENLDADIEFAMTLPLGSRELDSAAAALAKAQDYPGQGPIELYLQSIASSLIAIAKRHK